MNNYIYIYTQCICKATGDDEGIGKGTSKGKGTHEGGLPGAYIPGSGKGKGKGNCKNSGRGNGTDDGRVYMGEVSLPGKGKGKGKGKGELPDLPRYPLGVPA